MLRAGLFSAPPDAAPTAKKPVLNTQLPLPALLQIGGMRMAFDFRQDKYSAWSTLLWTMPVAPPCSLTAVTSCC